MANDVIQFVDSIASSPTVRLDINDGTTYRTKFDAPPPRLKRSISSNAMTDGGVMSSSSYDLRTLFAGIDLISASQDANATALQNLAREMDRESNFIKYQPVGASSPVFFRTMRADFAGMVDYNAALAFRHAEIELPADPFAAGIAETFSGSWSWNGASGGFQAATPTIKGDVSAPLVIDLDVSSVGVGATPSFWLFTQPSGSQIVRAATNASLGTLGTDASAVTGLSTSYWNTDAVAISFATTTTMATRVSNIQPSLTPGNYRLFAHFFDAGATASTYSARAIRTTSGGTIISTGASSSFALGNLAAIDKFIDLGIWAYPINTDVIDGMSYSTTYWGIQASRDTGTSANLRLDGLLWVPLTMRGVSGSTAAYVRASLPLGSGTTTWVRMDGRSDALVAFKDSLSLSDLQTPLQMAGAFPRVSPGANYLHWIPTNGALTTGTSTAVSSNYSASYNPLYLYVRPATT